MSFNAGLRGFVQNQQEFCVYKKASGSSVVFLVVYVDDILLMGNDVDLMKSVKAYLSNQFSMKDLGEAAYILGIKIYRDRSRHLIALSQSTYIEKILKRFKMENTKRGFTPMMKNCNLSMTQCPGTDDDREKMYDVPYASAIGSIMYAMLSTRPDVALALSLTSRCQRNPGPDH